ncbi:hypothetical protein EXM56_02765 [Clostridium botulinum]|uniref:Uncharacterized protein n=1 Tax=Clostridium botulinum TaxID=1491 RepID=A0A6G4CNH8_CLOBO|nr:hypothetical protein [Clostridium botulinum]NEZ99800.1 hypothetical protein [Clostridium botulinum]NFA31246.1 hypothetical protein [Clostridium botulinum]NFA85435.1 hypothetical protein [Clostridium botulinum]NFB07811.1 hypothetical protein [Clostridium botulinum]
MLSTTLYADKETQFSIEENEDRFCLTLSKLFDYNLSIVGQREVFEKLNTILELKLYEEKTYKELEEQLINKELLLEEAQNQIEYLKNRIIFLER